MRTAQQTLDQTFAEMRWRCLSLAADLDRIERSPGGPSALTTDDRLLTLTKAITTLLEKGPDRAQRVQMLFSDRSPAPAAAAK